MSGIANTGYVNTGYNLYTSGIQHPAWSEGTVLGIILDIIIGYNSYGVDGVYPVPTYVINLSVVEPKPIR